MQEYLALEPEPQSNIPSDYAIYWGKTNQIMKRLMNRWVKVPAPEADRAILTEIYTTLEFSIRVKDDVIAAAFDGNIPRLEMLGTRQQEAALKLRELTFRYGLVNCSGIFKRT